MEKKLWSAALLKAFKDLKSKRYARSAEHWFFRSKEDGPGSLQWICQALEIDIIHVRAKAIELNRKYSNLLAV